MWGRIISTHALTEGDCHPPERRTLLMKFQLTPSRRATHLFGQLSFHILISTHALTEGDHQPAATGSPVSYFNSRPHGGRLHWLFFFAHQAIFQLTPSRRATSARVSTDAVEVAFQLTPSRRATHLFGQLSFHILISTHALTEGDHQPAATGSPVSYFNSRPHGGRPRVRF